MTILTAIMANPVLVRIAVLVKLTSVDPILLVWEISQRFQGQVLHRDDIFNVLKVTVWTSRAETKRIVLADGLFHAVPEAAKLFTLHAETTLVVRTRFFGIRLSLNRMPKHTGVLLVTLAKLYEECTDGHLFRIIPMQVATLVAFLASTAKPVNAHLRLLFILVFLLVKRHNYLLNLVDSDLASLARSVMIHRSSTVLMLWLRLRLRLLILLSRVRIVLLRLL